MTLDPGNQSALLLSAIAALLVFAAIILVFSELAARRYKRRLKAVYDRAKIGGGSAIPAAAQSLTRIESTTPILIGSLIAGCHAVKSLPRAWRAPGE